MARNTTAAANYFRGDSMDDFFVSLALFRKQIALDETSIFRTVSEQVYATQKFYHELKECCLAYIGRNSRKFEHLSDVQSYILALANLYKRDFLVYRDVGKPPVNLTNFGYGKKVVLCESFGAHFDCVYPRSFQQKAAICQALTYEILYKNVFHMTLEVDAAICLVRKQNHRFKQNLPASPTTPGPRPFFYPSSPGFVDPINLSQPRCPSSLNFAIGATPSSNGGFGSRAVEPPYSDNSPMASYYLGTPLTNRRSRHEEIIYEKELEMEMTGPPFPYKVAKSLDPVVYRNTDYDTWLEDRKGQVAVSRQNSELDSSPGSAYAAQALPRTQPHMVAGTQLPVAEHFAPPNFQASSPAMGNVVTPAVFLGGQQPNEEDMFILRRFYELGGCNYFRHCLAMAHQFPTQLPPPQPCFPYPPPAVIVAREQTPVTFPAGSMPVPLPQPFQRQI